MDGIIANQCVFFSKGEFLSEIVILGIHLRFQGYEKNGNPANRYRYQHGSLGHVPAWKMDMADMAKPIPQVFVSTD